jgi:hypothetical protein
MGKEENAKKLKKLIRSIRSDPLLNMHFKM